MSDKHVIPESAYTNCLYMLKHDSAYNYQDAKAVKIGSSKHLVSRMYSYKTYYPIDKKVICFFYIEDYDCYQLDDDIKVHFDSQRIKSTGGIEYYLNIDSTDIEKYLIERNIKYTRYFYPNDCKVYNINEQVELFKQISKEYENYSNYLSSKIVKKSLRDEIQELYVNECIEQLEKYNRVFIKAPTGFGKTHIFYKVIKKMGLIKVLFLTPRILLNQQIVENKYSNYINSDNYKVHHFSDTPTQSKEKLIEDISKSDSNYLLTSCYQSADKLFEYVSKFNIKFDLIVYDEAHFITSWLESEFLTTNSFTTYRIFGSATPVGIIEDNPNIYGNIIEKVKVYELINQEILCNIQTIIKKLNNKKSEYHNLKDLIIESFGKYKKKKGIVYVNSRANAQSLYELMKTQDKISTYIYVSGTVEVEDLTDADIKTFEENQNPSIIIVVGKIGYGYDNDYIDFICLGDPRQSDIEIRQIIGRGIRYNKETYPNKLLHLLVPLYKDEFDNYSDNEQLKKYLDYIIGECGKDIISKSDGTGYIGDGNNNGADGEDYDGETIPIEILESYCTTGYNKFSDFQRFLKNNKIFDEVDYNQLWEKHKSWMVPIKDLKKKYPKFGFQNIHYNKNEYYSDKNTAKEKFEEAKTILKKNIGLDKFSEMTFTQQLKKIILINNKIPPVDMDLYYP